MHATIPKGNIGYDQYTVPDDCSCRTYFCCIPLALANVRPWPFVTILSNFFEKQRTQNNPQCLSGLSRALFTTTFLEIAVRTTTNPSHTGNGYSCKPTAWPFGMIKVYFYFVVNFPSKQNKVCITFGFPVLRRTGKFKPLLLYKRVG